MMENMIISEGTNFYDPTFFKDDEKHDYDVECYDGYAVGTLVDETDAPKKINITYPKLAEILADENKVAYVLRYRGLYNLTAKDIRYDDIMLAYGEIVY